jgi:hypothetical protein
MWTDRHIDMTELIVDIRNLAKTPKNLLSLSNHQIRKPDQRKTVKSVYILHAVPLLYQSKTPRRQQPRTFPAE